MYLRIPINKIAFLFCIACCFCLNLYSIEQTTIIDTIWTENSLQGGIGYHVINGTYYGGIIPFNQDISEVGDSWDQYGDGNDICIRSYFSFPIQQTPEGYVIDSVRLLVWQSISVGNDQPGFPIWYDHQYIPCYLYHVDYGLIFEPVDFDPLIYDTIGIIFSDDQSGWKTLSVTNAYLYDLNYDRPYCQFMFKFPIITDYDNASDAIDFENSYGGIYAIRLVITYTSTSSVDDNVTSNDNNLFNIAPNPFRDKTTLSYILPSKQPVQLAIYNLKGQQVFSLPNAPNQKGLNAITWNGTDDSGRQVSSGIYFCRLKTTEQMLTAKLMILM